MYEPPLHAVRRHPYSQTDDHSGGSSNGPWIFDDLGGILNEQTFDRTCRKQNCEWLGDAAPLHLHEERIAHIPGSNNGFLLLGDLAEHSHRRIDGHRYRTIWVFDFAFL